MKGTIEFLDEENRNTERRRRLMYKLFSQIFINVLFEDLEFHLREVIDRTEDWFRAFFEMDVMI